jgi:hypothetical protein
MHTPLIYIVIATIIKLPFFFYSDEVLSKKKKKKFYSNPVQDNNVFVKNVNEVFNGLIH